MRSRSTASPAASHPACVKELSTSPMAEGGRRTSSVHGLWAARRAGRRGARARHNAASSTLLRRCTHVRARYGPHHSPPLWSRPITSRMGHGPAYVQRSFRPFCRGTCSRPKSTLFGGALAEPKSPSNSPARCAGPHGGRPRSSVMCREAVAATMRSRRAVRMSEKPPKVDPCARSPPPAAPHTSKSRLPAQPVGWPAARAAGTPCQRCV